MTRRLYKIAVFAAGGLLVVAGLSMSAVAQQTAQQAPQQIRTPRQSPFPVNPDFSRLEIQTLKVQGNIYLLAGAGGNIAVQIGDEGILLAGTGYEQRTDKVLASIHKLSNKPT